MKQKGKKIGIKDEEDGTKMEEEKEEEEVVGKGYIKFCWLKKEPKHSLE